jgi:hypothetical protein
MTTIPFVECTPCYGVPAEPIPTLNVLEHPEENESRDSWPQAAREINRLLLDHGVIVAVDIIDWRLYEGPVIHLCEPTDAIFGRWDDVRARILRDVDVSWFQLLGCYPMGYEIGSANCPPTVLVIVNPKFARDWKKAEQDIRNILTAEFQLPVRLRC